MSGQGDEFIAPRCEGIVRILYQDAHLLVIDKPSGLLSLSGKNLQNWDSVHYRLVHGQAGATPAFKDAKLPHRLDFGTSGIMLVALNAHAAKQLNKQFQAGSITKRYLAILNGHVSQEKGDINAPIAKDPLLFPRVKISQQEGKTSISDYQVLARLNKPKRTLVQYSPRTGRTHQLRIHSLHFGHPILGCDLYGNAQSLQLAPRLMLHASDIYFTHPETGQAFHGHSPSPF
ncbi:RluA family pseudouridine synthase [Oceanisphaera avium]|uniref:RNA pseudouridine synthase n=1 Tax=Oceanisphaera avium TaxID=1903694 RepID=A0A1Y0CWB1_9GAMM|nr:RluA family pseudouridine synthase [Oceanisphaera avium]ART79187.1 RNA pseudouridine synthase [Oceanisphaera avium]